MTSEILVVGAGAIGAFYGSRLALGAKQNVSAICRSNYAAVKANGFHVTSSQYGDHCWTPTHTFANPAEARQHKTAQRWDYILVSTKALPDVSDDSEILEGLVGDDTAIVLVQNGIGVEEPYARRFPNATILSGVTIASAAQTEPGFVRHNRWTRITVGPYLPHTNDGKSSKANDGIAIARNERFVRLLQDGGIKDALVYTHAKLQLVRWHKIAINASMNPSSVLSGGSANGDMATDPELYIHLKGVMDEVLTTAPKIIGAPFPKDFASSEAILKSTAKNTSGSKPSMALDWEQGKSMELEVILGNPIRVAREHGFEMPRLQSLYALLKKAQANRESQKAKSKL